MRQRDIKSHVLKIEVKDPFRGIDKILNTQEEIIAAAAEFNIRHQPQTVGMAFQLPPLVKVFGTCANNKDNCNVIMDGDFIPDKDADLTAIYLLGALGMTVSTPIIKQEITSLRFAFLDDADLVTGADDVHKSGTTIIARFQALMTCWNDGI